MKRFLTVSATVCALALVWAPLFAQDMMDQASGIMGNGGVGTEANAYRVASPTVILNTLEGLGFTDISPLPPTTLGSPMNLKATAPGGAPVDLIVDPATGKLISATPQ